MPRRARSHALTRQEEVHAAAEVARTVVEAIELVLQVHAASGADR
jgi:hypothetical protein